MAACEQAAHLEVLSQDTDEPSHAGIRIAYQHVALK